MKGTISPELERILRDKNARVQLREALTNGLSGPVTVDGTTYQVTSVREMEAPVPGEGQSAGHLDNGKR